jgi:DNA modification methylase
MTQTVLTGDCIETMFGLADGVARCCVTSPPYFGLRDYGHDGQIGLEPTPAKYVARLVEVFRAVRRVLADDGTLWLNLGDSYNSGASGALMGSTLDGGEAAQAERRRAAFVGDKALPPKSLLGIPWRVAFALQENGWTLRSDIIWHKPNPMPESVTDRPTKSHEYLFLFSKSRRYFYDAKAIAEDAVCGSRGSEFHTGKTGEHQLGRASKRPRPSAPKGSFGGKWQPGEAPGENASFRAVTETRNARTVWTIPTKPFKGAHFAVFPEALAEKCILAGSAVGDTVLDPFGGSGTVGVVAAKRGRSAILCELNPTYATMARDRIAATQPGLGLEAA